MPGDVITINDGNVYVNGNLIDQNFTLDGYTNGTLSNCVVPEGEVFVLGDNRLNSIDSREIGTQRIDDVKGVAFVRLWPLHNFGKLD